MRGEMGCDYFITTVSMNSYMIGLVQRSRLKSWIKVCWSLEWSTFYYDLRSTHPNLPVPSKNVLSVLINYAALHFLVYSPGLTKLKVKLSKNMTINDSLSTELIAILEFLFNTMFTV